MLSIVKAVVQSPTLNEPQAHSVVSDAARRKANRVLWLKLNFTVKAARLQTLKRQKYQHLQEEALLKARGLLKNWENGVVVLTEDLYRRAAGERDAQELMNYTPEALALRFSLRNDPRVLEAVKQLWQIDMPRDSMGCIDQRGYASVFRRVAKSLDAKAFKKKQKVDRLLDEDWKRDSKGDATMSFANFFDSIFELADLWCETIDAEDYVAFLNRLRDRISQQRQGKRILRLMSKVTAFDVESGDEEEEEEEEDDDASSGSDAPVEKAPVQPVAPPRLLVAKSILPSQPQQPARQQQQSRLRKASQVALTSKAMNRKPATTAEPPKAAINSQPVVLQASLTVPQAQDPQPLVPVGTPSRQRRASVVTTIQFLDDGFVRSSSEGISEVDAGTGTGAVHHRMSSSAAAALSAIASKRAQPLRPSLAAVAAAALGRTDEDTEASSGMPRFSITSEPQQRQSSEDAHAVGRKRIITVSTTKRAVLKSLVIAKQTTGASSTRQTGLGNQTSDTTDMNGDDGQQVEGDDTTVEAMDQPLLPQQYAKAKGFGSRANASTSVALRMRTGSLFMLNAHTTKGTASEATAMPGVKPTRFGLTASVAMRNRGGGQLAPLAAANSSQPTVGSVTATAAKANGHASTESPTSTPATVLGSSASAPTLSSSFTPEFSGSVVTTSYGLNRASPIATTKGVNIIGSTKKPPVASPLQYQQPTQQRGFVVGTKALAQDEPTSPVQAPVKDAEPVVKKPMVLVMQKPAPQPEPQLHDPHRNAGHALHSTADHTAAKLAVLTSPLDGPQGSPEHAIYIKAALDLGHSHRPERPVTVTHEPIYSHTEPANGPASSPYREHGLTIQSFTGPAKVRVSPLKPVRSPPKISMDPSATPWDTSDDEDACGNPTSHEPNLLLPESALDVLAKVRSKRAASLSAGSTRSASSTTRPRSTSSASSTRQPRSRSGSLSIPTRQDHSTDSDDEDIDDEGRSNLLTVASLGGRSTATAERQGTSRSGRRQHTRDQSNDDGTSLRTSISAPALPTITQLELDYSQPAAPIKRKKKDSLAAESLAPARIHVGVRRRRPQTPDDLHLRGELAMDPSRSPPRSPPRTSPRKICVCTCSKRHDANTESTADADDQGATSPVAGLRLDQYMEDGTACPSCSAGARTRESDATLIFNAKREVVLQPIVKEEVVIADANREPPTRSEMMRRRHRYTHGRPV